MDIRTIGVPMDLGADRRGVDMGPSAIRYAGLDETLADIGHTVLETGDVSVPRPEATSDPDPDGLGAKYLPQTRSVCSRLREAVGEAIADDETPLVLGGDHSIAIGTIAGSARDADVGVLWFDAHGDFNTPATTPSGNVHGMSLAALLGEGSFADARWATADVDPENVALVGIRDLDDGEKDNIRESGVAAYTMSDIDARGLPAVLADAIDRVGAGADGLHVSLDLDWLDPREAPGVGTPVQGGVTYREAHAAMERIAAADAPVRSMEAVEVNPILDDHNRTAELAVELVASAFGKRIL